jgi:hypothetical protein
MEEYIIVRSGRAFTGSSQWGYRATVDMDGTVRVYDSIAGHYTTCHALTTRQLAYVRRMWAR